MAYNKTIIQGNLVRDVELKATQSGKSVCQFSVAVSTRFKAADGTQKEEVLFIDVEAWGQQATTIAKFFQKGSPILVDGRLKQESWEKDGEKRSKIKLVLENFTFVGNKQEADKKEEDEIPY